MEKFWSKVAITANPERCWEWQAGRQVAGYGAMQIKGKVYGAHVLSLFLRDGRMPRLHVLHSCDNPPCVNPNHLREGTHQENMQDAKMRGRFNRQFVGE